MGFGRPRAYDSPAEFAEKIAQYFRACDEDKEIITDAKGQPVKIFQRPYTISGMCVYLGITRETLTEYAKRPGFDEIVKAAKQFVENYVEENSLTGKLNPIMSIFNLKNNFGWTDKLDISTNVQQERLSEDYVRQKLKERQKAALIEEEDEARRIDSGAGGETTSTIS